MFILMYINEIKEFFIIFILCLIEYIIVGVPN